MGQSFHHDHDHDHHGHGPHHHGHGRIGWAYGAFVAIVGLLLVLYAFDVIRTVFGVVDLALVLTLVAGFPLLRHALLDLLRGHFSSHLTIAIAAGAAVAVGELFAAAEVTFIMLLGEGLEHYTVDRAKRAIAGFVAMEPKVARVRRQGQEVELEVSQVQVDDCVVVRAGEKVPVDGEVTEGESTVDESMITGEPMPASKSPGDFIYSGSVNEYGVLLIRAQRVGEETTLARIARLIREAQAQRAPIVRTADELARYFLPAVLLLSGAIYLLTGEMLRTVAALIVACPCALVLATPAAMAAAIARLAREGVLVKGGEVVEAMARVTAVALDKTGTLTLGRPRVDSLLAAPGVDEEEVLAVAAAAEEPSEHLLGRAIVDEARQRQLPVPKSEGFVMRPGLGVRARVGERDVRVGNLAMILEGTAPSEEELAWARETLAAETPAGQIGVLVAADSRPLGVIRLRDPVRPEAPQAVAEIKRMGMARVTMLTGDQEATAQHVGRQIGIDEIHAACLPEDKVTKIRQLKEEGLRVLMVGDGVNDAPALAAADVGLALGRGAADISAEAAQVVFLKDRLDYLPHLIAYCRKTLGRIRSSILLFAFGINFAAVGVAAFGYLSPALAAVVHQGASLFVILNCVRLLVEGRAVEEKKGGGWVARLRHRLAPSRQLRRLGGLLAPCRPRLQAAGGWMGAHRRELYTGSLILLPVLWLTTGLTPIALGEVGVVERLGRQVGSDLGPGLHYRWPWPLETVSRLRPGEVRLLEVGFRTVSLPLAGAQGRPMAGEGEPAAYEWSTGHDQGRLRQRLEESLVLTGDENLVEVYAAVHYSVAHPARYLFGLREPEKVLRVTAEQTLRRTLGHYPLDAILTHRRRKIEAGWERRLQAALDRYESGLGILSVYLKDVHPPVEVVPAFRQVASAAEERSTLINQAEGYLRERAPLARGEARARLLMAQAYSSRRVSHSQGESRRFLPQAAAYARAPEVTAFRLYLETLEAVLPEKRKYVAHGSEGGRRRFLFLDGLGALDGDHRDLVRWAEPQSNSEEP